MAERPHGAPLLRAYMAGALVGVLLLVVAGQRYRIDLVRCATWPPLSTGLVYGAAYAVALTLLSIVWLGIINLTAGQGLFRKVLPVEIPRSGRPTAALLLLLGTFLHAVALAAPPFLSDDPLAYAAIGRAMRLYHQDMYAPLGSSLPVYDVARRAISMYPDWLSVGSAYSPGFNWLSSLIVGMAGGDLALSLRLFQVVGLITVVLTASLAGQAARLVAEREPDRPAGTELHLPHGPAPDHRSDGEQAAARAVAMVLFCPLTLLEATVNAHNDGLLMLGVALFVLFVVRERPLAALFALTLGLLVKASALLLCALYALHLLSVQLRRFDSRQVRRKLLIGGLGLLLLATGAVCARIHTSAAANDVFVRYLSSVVRLFGNPHDKVPYCTRSIECFPRALLHVILNMPVAAWYVGIAFRGLGALFLLYMALRRGRGTEYLGTVATFLFLYYLYLHGWSWPWYGLSLLPLLPYAGRRTLPAMLALPVANLSHYVLALPFNCDHTILAVGLTQVIGGLMIVVPSTVLLWRGGRARPTAQTL